MMQENCKSLSAFFQFIDKSPTVSIQELRKEAERIFERAAIKAGDDFLSVEFNKPISCFRVLTKNWGSPVDFQMISPPPLMPGVAPLKLDPNDNPYMWETISFKRQSIVVALAVHKDRIKNFSIKK